MLMLVVERIENDLAVCELSGGDNSMTQLVIKLSGLPDGVKSGDVLVKMNDGYAVDREETKKRREKIIRLQNSLWE